MVKPAVEAEETVSENRIIVIDSEGNSGDPLKLGMKYPLSSIFTATVGAGSEPLQYIAMRGTPDGMENTINYASIHVG